MYDTQVCILAAFIDHFKGQGTTGLMIVHRISMRGKMASVYRPALLLRGEYERVQHGNDYFKLKMLVGESFAS